MRRTISLDDLEMSIEDRGVGEPLFLLHGGGGIGANWDLVFPESPAGYRLLAPDLRGHGRTANPVGRFSFRQCARDVLQLADRLEIASFKAIGLSLGAKTLLHVATAEPSRVSAMVLVSAAPYFPEQARAIMRSMRPDNRTEAEWRHMREWHQNDEQIVALWKMANDFAENYDDMTFTPPQLATISARTLIVHGDRDELYPVRLALEMYEAIPRATLWVVPNAGHGPIFGPMAESFVATAMAFLADRENP